MKPDVEYMVEDLKRRQQRGSALTFSSIRPEELAKIKNNDENNVIRVDTINMQNSTNINTEENKPNTIRISSNVKKKPMPRRSPDEVEILDADKVTSAVAPEKVAEPPSEDLRGKLYDQVEATILRKKKEFKDFIESAEEADRLNREKIADGIEDGPSGELTYRITDLPMDDRDPNKAKALEEKQLTEPDLDEVEIDLENSLIGIEDTNTDSINVNAITMDPFANAVTEEDDIKPMDKEIKEAIHVETPEERKARLLKELEELDNVSTFEDSSDDEKEIENNDTIEEDLEVSEEEEVEEENEPVEVETKTEATVEPEIRVEKVEKIISKEDDENKDVSKEINEELSKGNVTIVKEVPLENPLDKVNINNISNDDISVDNDDFSDLDDDDPDAMLSTSSEISEEERTALEQKGLNNLKSEILQKVIKAGKRLDTTQFAVSNKVVSIKDVLKKQKEVNIENTVTASWPLLFSGRPFIATPLKGPEVGIMYTMDRDEDPNNVGLTIRQLHILYEHDANPYKPTTPQAWAKTIPFADTANILVALYAASLNNSNYLPMSCPEPKCQHQFLTDDVPIENMVKFGDDKTKEKFNSIKSVKLTAENSTSYESVISVVNDMFAVGLRLPSIYSSVYELGSLDSNFVEKYSAVLSILQYIDYIYMLDPDTKSYIPIAWKVYGGDITKSYKSKISTYSKILQEFTSTEFSILRALVGAMLENMADGRDMSYIVPEGRCPKCGSTIPEVDISARDMVFMKQRLVNIATM